MKRRTVLSILSSIVLTGTLSLSIIIYYISNPSYNKLQLQLPPGSTPNDNTLLHESIHEDFDILINHFQPQIYRSFCGVASSSAVLSALGLDTTQESFFEKLSLEGYWSFLKVFFSGMQLSELADLIAAHGASVELTYASDANIEVFRKTVKENLKNANDFLLVNYSRKALDQAGGGHISPVGAYDPESDRILILDTAGYKYPYHWVKLTDLFDAMNTLDGAKTRGYVTIAKY